jgi:hypothetical protein
MTGGKDAADIVDRLIRFLDKTDDYVSRELDDSIDDNPRDEETDDNGEDNEESRAELQQLESAKAPVLTLIHPVAS